jgi:hypothetical protein
MPEKPSKDKRNDKAWYEIENRLTIPVSFEGEYEIRQEPVNRDAIIKFMNHMAARKVSGKHGRLIHNLAMLLHRTSNGDEDFGMLTVLSYRRTDADGLLYRRMTGLGVFPTVPPPDVQAAFQHELELQVPRTSMGKSAFHLGSLATTSARSDIPLCNSDLRKAFIQLRLAALPDEVRSKLRVLPGFLEQDKKIIAKLSSTGVSEDDIKQLIIAATNMQATQQGLPPALQDFLAGIKADSKDILNYFKRQEPELLARFRLFPNGDLKFLALLDHDMEARAVDKMDSKACSNEYDGVVEFLASWDEVDATFKRHAAAVAPLAIGMKPYGAVLELAKSKKPGFDWDAACSELDGPSWYRKWRQCMAALRKGPARCHAINTVFGQVIRCSSALNICKNGGGRFELFQNGFWKRNCEYKDLKEFVKQELLEIFHNNPELNPREPLETDGFISAVVTCVVDYMPQVAENHSDALDNRSHLKLLDAEGTVYNWETDTFRKQRAEDRLYRKMPKAFVLLPDDEQQKINRFCKALKDYYKLGGKTLQPFDEEDTEGKLQEEPELRDARLALANSFDTLRTLKNHELLQGLWNIYEDRQGFST